MTTPGERLRRRLAAFDERCSEALEAVVSLKANARATQALMDNGVAFTALLAAFENGHTDRHVVAAFVSEVALVRGELCAYARSQGSTFREVEQAQRVSRRMIHKLIARAHRAPLP